jgi:hypothetical protein
VLFAGSNAGLRQRDGYHFSRRLRVGKGRGNIATLPLYLREQLNEKLLNNGETYAQMATWLLGCPIKPGGVPISTLYEDVKNAQRACEVAINRWFLSKHYERWAKDAALRGDILRTVRNIETKFKALGEDGQDRYMQSVIMQCVEIICTGKADSLDVRRLASAYAQMRGLKHNDARVAILQSQIQSVADSPTSPKGGVDHQGKLALLNKVLEEAWKR